MSNHTKAVSVKNTVNHILYEAYRKLDPKIKKKRIDESQQSEQYRKPNPQGNCQFDEYGFIDFYVEEEGKKIKLETYRQNARGEIIGVIFMFHGLNSYMGHGAHLAKYFSEHGLTTVGFDHRGFGRSDGREGYVDTLEAHLQDSMKFIKLVLPMYEHLPRFVLGLSMGGMTSYFLSLQNPKLFDGAILMAPAMKNSVGGKVVKLTKVLESILPDKTRLLKPIYGKATKNPAVTDFVRNDKYAFSERMPLSTVQMIISTMQKAPKTFHRYKCPFMIIQGGLDKLVNPQVAFELYDQSQTPLQDKQFLFYENMWHDIWHEDEIHDILPKIVGWIKKRISLKKGIEKIEQKSNWIHQQKKQTEQKQESRTDKQLEIHKQIQKQESLVKIQNN